jgi:translocation and assembly module TamA
MNLRERIPSVRTGMLVLAALCWGAVVPVASAAIHVEVTGVDSTLRRNVLALLSLERYKDRDRIEPDAVARLFRRVNDEVSDALKPYGYYAPTVEPKLSREENGRDWRVQINIKLGEPVLLDTISVIVRGAGATDPVFARVISAPELVKGRRLEHAAYEKVKSDLQLAAATYGYLDARLLRSELQVDPQAHRANVFLDLESGERYRFGATTLDQNAIREPQLRRYLRYQEGEPYDAGKLLRTQFALDDSQFFSNVEVTQGDRDAATHIVPIHITATTARNTYSFAAGYGTDTGARGTISWLNPLVNNRGHRLRVLLQISQRTDQLNARYDIPIGDPVLEKFSLQALDQTETVNTGVDTRERSLTPSITQSFGRWQRVVSLAFAHTESTDAINGRLVDDLIVPGITYASVPEGYLGEDLFSRALYAELIGSTSALGANANFLRLDLRTERMLNIAPLWHLLLRGEAGTSAIGNFQELPITYRFFAGGDRSVRGFAFNELSPVQTVTSGPAIGTQVRAGGRNLLTGTVEFDRDLPRNFGLAVFTDFGNAFNRFGDPLAVSVGVGFRWRLPVVSVGFDVAQAVRAPGFEPRPGPRLHLNITPQF